MNPGLDTHRNTHGPMETRDLRDHGFTSRLDLHLPHYRVVARSSWGKKSLYYYDKMHKGPLRAETLLTSPGFGHRICILCTFLFSHQTKTITRGCEKTFGVNCILFRQLAVNVRRMFKVRGHKYKCRGNNSQNCRFDGSVKHSGRPESCSFLGRRLCLSRFDIFNDRYGEQGNGVLVAL